MPLPPIGPPGGPAGFVGHAARRPRRNVRCIWVPVSAAEPPSSSAKNRVAGAFGLSPKSLRVPLAATVQREGVVDADRADRRRADGRAGHPARCRQPDANVAESPLVRTREQPVDELAGLERRADGHVAVLEVPAHLGHLGLCPATREAERRQAGDDHDGGDEALLIATLQHAETGASRIRANLDRGAGERQDRPARCVRSRGTAARSAGRRWHPMRRGRPRTRRAACRAAPRA